MKQNTTRFYIPVYAPGIVLVIFVPSLFLESAPLLIFLFLVYAVPPKSVKIRWLSLVTSSFTKPRWRPPGRGSGSSSNVFLRL